MFSTAKMLHTSKNSQVSAKRDEGHVKEECAVARNKTELLGLVSS